MVNPLMLVPMVSQWIKLNPGKALNNIAIYGGIGLTVLALGWLYWDYQDAKSDRAKLRVEVSQLQQLTTDQRDAINNFVEAEKRYQALIRDIEKFKGDLADELEAVREGLTSEDIREAAKEDADQATTDVVIRVNDNFRLFDNATDPRRADPTADEVPSD
jgi:hypothetical protein